MCGDKDFFNDILDIDDSKPFHEPGRLELHVDYSGGKMPSDCEEPDNCEEPWTR
jgi:hypothetical protein